MPYLLQSYTSAGREQFSSNQPPYAYLGRVFCGPNTGRGRLTSTARAGNSQAPDFSPAIEQYLVTVPAGTAIIGVVGDKLPIRMGRLGSSVFFLGTMAGSLTLYCFGPYNGVPAGPGSGAVCETYNQDGSLAWDAKTLFLTPVTNVGTGYIGVPSGRTWAAVMVGAGVSDLYRSVANTLYYYIQYSAPSVSAAAIQMSSNTADIRYYGSGGTGEGPTGQSYRTASYYAIDVTGYP